jgi:predicted DsbA family dithiol-disulfide isomerase
LGANLDFEFSFAEGKRIVNTFNAHQLLHWAGETSDKQTELKMALLIAYFKEGRDVSDIEVLAEIAVEVGLDDSSDASFSKQLLQDQVYAGDVRALQEQWRGMGISAVPSFIIDEKYIISGGQSASAFVQGLRQMIEGK